mmetsp:Transcript_2530/g.7259  ORF Transcript_2530/g.7259 Transcript_2530/m.7259 type:complete len:204 (+) Transcript_2530:226-837(+)
MCGKATSARKAIDAPNSTSCGTMTTATPAAPISNHGRRAAPPSRDHRDTNDEALVRISPASSKKRASKRFSLLRRTPTVRLEMVEPAGSHGCAIRTALGATQRSKATARATTTPPGSASVDSKRTSAVTGVGPGVGRRHNASTRAPPSKDLSRMCVPSSGAEKLRTNEPGTLAMTAGPPLRTSVSDEHGANNNDVAGLTCASS